MRKKTSILMALLLCIIVFIGHTIKKTYNVADITNTHSYKYQFAILNKTFKRDLFRTLQLYISFEKYFLNADNIPFFIVVPASDLIFFQDTFTKAKHENVINLMPLFLTEQEVLEKSGEPDVTFSGPWAMQTIKLSFGLTGLAKSYMSIDSDSYFTKTFDKNLLFERGILKTFRAKINYRGLQSLKKQKLFLVLDQYVGYLDGHCPPIHKCVYDTTGLEALEFIKYFFGSKNKEYNNFVNGHAFFNSDAIFRMKKFVIEKGLHSLARLIRIVPFEMQWYGEYMLQHEIFMPDDRGVFALYTDPSACLDESGGNNFYGITLNSMDYSIANFGIRKEIRYKKPSHCK